MSNVINGAPLVNTLGQVGLAATSGAILYLFRRGTGLLVAGMVAHGVWDMSLSCLVAEERSEPSLACRCSASCPLWVLRFSWSVSCVIVSSL